VDSLGEESVEWPTVRSVSVALPGYRIVESLAPAARGDGSTGRRGADGAGRAPGGPARAGVWRAVRLADGASVALKVFGPDQWDRAQREADLARTVDHPHVLPVLDVAAGPDAVALVLPLATGGSLAGLLSVRLRLRWAEVLTVLIPVADALAAAHERDIVHGDLSAANVLLQGDGRPMLADLGAARAAGELGGLVAATPTDVAPETARGEGPTPAADLFSLGSVALHSLCGRPAWPAQDLQDVLICSATGQWPDPDDLMGPPELLAIIRRLLDPDPRSRGSAAQVAVELRRVGEPEPVELVTHRSDGSVSGPAPATMVRPDAARPPGRSGAGRRAGSRRGAARRSRAGRVGRVVGQSRTAAIPAGRHHRRRRWSRRSHTVGGGVLGRGSGRAVGAGDSAGVRPGRRRERFVAGRRSVAWQRVGRVGGRDGENAAPAAGRAPAAPRRSTWPPIIAVAIVVLLGFGAVRAGLWWSSWGDPPPVSAADGTVGDSAAPRGTPPAVTGPTPTGAATGDTASSATSPSPSESSEPELRPGGVDDVAGSDQDWLAVVAALDASRAAALTTRDVSRLGEVYTASAAARAADARQIRAMTAAGYHVTRAAHRLSSATLAHLDVGGAVTVRVVASLPSYPVLNADGLQVGHTAAAEPATVLLRLEPTDGGFRISRITRS